METLARDRELYLEIIQWEKNLLEYTPNEAEVLLDQVLGFLLEKIPSKAFEDFVSITDELIFQVYSTLQDTDFDRDFRDRLLNRARLFDEEIRHVAELAHLSTDQLMFLEANEVAKSKTYSYLQGGLTGISNNALSLLDIPGILVINLRAVQQIALTYGFDPKDPREQVIALKVFYAGVLPKRHKKFKWLDLNDEINKEPEFSFIYDGDLNQLDQHIVELIIYEFIKLFILSRLRKGKNAAVSAALNAYVNGSITDDITEFATNFYRKRWLLNK